MALFDPLLVKGLTVKARLDFARDEGDERILQRLRETPGAVATIATTPMLSMRQFPLADYDALCRAIANLLKRDHEMVYRQMGAYQADLQRPLQNVSMGKKTDPAQLVAALPRHLLIHFAGAAGALRHEQPGERLGRVFWEKHPEASDSLCHATLGYVARLLENAGVIGVGAGDRECRARGDSRCVWDFTWEKASGLRRATIDLHEQLAEA